MALPQPGRQSMLTSPVDDLRAAIHARHGTGMSVEFGALSGNMRTPGGS